MTKISTYVVDEKVTALDKWIGSDANMQNRTKNFTPKKLAAYFNEDQVINIGTPLQYKYYTLDPLEARPNGTLTFETEIGPTVNFSSITTFLLSKYTTKQNIVSDFLNFLDGSKVLLFKSSDINSFGFYRISSLEPYEPDPNFFVVTVAYETGNGALEEDEDYMISLVSLAGDFIPTKTSELINDGDDGVNPFISELDINRIEWDAAYEGKINSAEVTGTATKTLTLTKQDGGTIEASWTDSDTGLTSVGVSMPTAFSVANSPLTSNGTINITGAGTSLEYIKGDGTLGVFPTLTGYVPYTGATQDVDLGTHQLKADSLAVSTTSTETIDVGEIVWNAVDGTFDMGLIGGVALQAGQEMHMYGKATEVISNGQAVMFAGVQGDHILIAKADTTTINSNPEYFIGIATQDFANNQFGYVTVFGNVRGLNTTGYTLGSVLYYNSQSATDGLLTATEPTAPNAKIIVAAVVRVHATQGILLVRPHIMPKLKDVQDVYAPSPSNNNGLFWNSSTLRYENNSIIGALGYTPYNATNPSNYITLGSISSTATGLTYTNTTGVFSLTSGYVIPTTTEESNWNDAYSNRITSASTPLSISSNAISISQAGSSTNGYLTSTDWNIFNNKQVAGNYITSLTGEATASGPGAASVTLNNASVTAKILSGVNITGGTILDTDTMLTAFGKLQNQINSLIGGSIYQGVWNASTNTPTLTSSVGTDGNYYIVNVAGSTNLNGITDWKIGDWAIFHGGTWQKVDNTDAVSSVNGFTGAVSLTTDNIPEGTTNLYFTDSRVSTNIDVSTNTSARHNAVTIGTANGLSLSTQALSLELASSVTNGALSSTDWNVFNNKQNALGYTAANDANVVHLTGTETITGTKTFSSLVSSSLKISTFGAGMVYSDSIGNVGTLTGTANTLTYWSSAGNIASLATSTYPSLTEISYVKGVTSSIQTQLNNKQNALTNPITGSLTTNYLPKATGSTTLGNSLIYDNGTNVGIGTTSPTSKLHVVGSAFFSSYVDLTGFVATGNNFMSSAGGIFFKGYNNFETGILTANSGNDFFIQTGSAERMRITSSGNVGIGTTSPLRKLTVTGSSGTTMIALENSGIDYYGIGMPSGSSDMAFYSSALTERMRITSGGNVGIGTTSPAQKLDVIGNIQASGHIGSGTGTTQSLLKNGNIEFYNAAISSKYIQLSDDSSIINAIGFSKSGSTSTTWFPSGNVGIGTTSPGVKLDISYSDSSGSYLPGIKIKNSANSSTSQSKIEIYNSADNYISLGQNSPSVNSGVAFLSTSSTDLTLGTAFAERMRITSGGNVGIGTTSPSFQLQLSNDSAAKPGSPLWTVSSDIRIKENVRPYTDGIDKLMQVNPVYYDYNGKAGFSITKDNVGIIAQEMQEVLPNTIKTFTAKLNEEDEVETELLSFNANELIYVLINSVKELKAEIEILKQK